MKFSDSYIGQPVYSTIDSEVMGYIVGLADIGDQDNIFVLIGVGDGIEERSYAIGLLEPCR